MAELALYLEAKKTGVVKSTYEDVPRMEQNLNAMGIYKIGDIANSDISVLRYFTAFDVVSQ